MDLGTANTVIISNGKIVVDEPSVVALDRHTDKMIAVGGKAKRMHEKTHDNIRTIRPLQNGVIADFNACEQMIRGLIKMVDTGRRLFSPSLRIRKSSPAAFVPAACLCPASHLQRTVILPLSFSKTPSLMPETFIRSSVLPKLPFACR